MLLSISIIFISLLNSIYSLNARCFVITSGHNSKVSGLIDFYEENQNSGVKITGQVYSALKINSFIIHDTPVYDGNCSNSGNRYMALVPDSEHEGLKHEKNSIKIELIDKKVDFVMFEL